MKKIYNFKKNTLLLAIGFSIIPLSSVAGPLVLVQYPPGTGSIEPAPNIVVSVDDSGSMGADGIKNLKDALIDTFSSTNIPDDRVRLAWQSMNRCSGIPSNSTACKNKNTMQSLSGQHRTNFLTWVNTLSASGWTPSFPLVRGVGTYLREVGKDSAWNKTPGTADPKPLACRKAYHIFMTDGEWNGINGTVARADGDRDSLSRILVSNSANIDGTSITLPDGKLYDVSSEQTRIYRDSWGFNDVTARSRTRTSVNHSWGGWSQYTDPAGMNTLADIAFYDWSTDLQPGIPNDMEPVIKKSGIETFGVGNLKVDLEEYWNPKNNPATWQNLVTYTIGFKGADTLTAPNASAPNFDNNAVIDEATHAGEFGKLVTGEKFWPTPFCGLNGDKPCETTAVSNTLENNSFNSPAGRSAYTNPLISNARMYELWHMAVNGRGKFMAAKDPAQLAGAFRKILSQIILDTTKPVTSFSATSSSVTTSSTSLYRAGYDATKWSGQIEAFTLAKGTGAGSANASWGGATDTTATKLDAASVTAANRKIYTVKSDTGSVIPFLFDDLHATQQAFFKKTGEINNAPAKNRIDFLRGERNLEGDIPAKPFRIRASRHGDVVNSALWFLGAPAGGFDLKGYSAFATSKKNRTPMLYVGANDGMLHGFSATDGTEKIAYIPQGLLEKLPALTEPNYVHQYYVDGSPFSGDIDTGTASTPAWKTVLAGSLGAGGKGYFVLDVTNPGDATGLVVTDQTSTTDADMGHIFGAPVPAEFNPQRSLQIAKMNDDRWALITGNGYNSTSGHPVLFIQYLSGAGNSLHKITAASTGANGTDNGLSTPRPVDLNGDGTVDVIYAGDLKGNMWKFDVSSKTQANWGVGFSSANCAATSCTPLFAALDPTGTHQPITSAPNVRTNKSVGGMMVAFGTGRNITAGDRTDRTSVHTFYAIVDNTKYELEKTGTDKGKVKAVTSPSPTTISDRSQLISRSFDGKVNGEGRSSDEIFWNMDDAKNPDFTYSSQNGKRGWYLDMPVGGERILTMPTFYDGSNVLDITSEVPAAGGNSTEESCSQPTLEGQRYQTLMGIEFGKRPTVQLLDSDGDGTFDPVEDDNTNRHTTDPGYGVKVNGGYKKVTGKETCATPDACKPETNEMPKPPLTINWRQLQ